jgi:hypothetical protein
MSTEPAGGHQDEQEGAEQLREQPPPFLAGILEIGNAIDDALFVARDRAVCGHALGHSHRCLTWGRVHVD